MHTCDECDGSGWIIEDDGNERKIECPLCEGAGAFDDDGFPVED